MTKIILITGATAGIGKATAELLAREGNVRLIITGRRTERLEKLKSELNCETHIIPMDVRDRAATLAAIASLPPEWAEVDVLLNNAGLAQGLSKFAESDFADFETMIDTNIKGLLTLTQSILPGMKKRGVGHIINISSIAGTYHYPGGHVYGASKAFVTYFSLALRADLLGAPIRVTNIEPGMTETEFSEVRFHGDKEKAGLVYKGITPLSAHDIANAICWAINQPPHVNINRIEIMPVMQAPAGLAAHRE